MIGAVSNRLAVLAWAVMIACGGSTNGSADDASSTDTTGGACDNGTACDDLDACTTADTCQDGVCAGTPVVCDAPPEPMCVDTSVLRTFAPGACSAGACTYGHTDTTCAAGCVGKACQPIVLASGQAAAGIAVDGTNVYWTIPGSTALFNWTGKVMKVGIGGGMPVTLINAQPHPVTIVTDGTSVYWTTHAYYTDSDAGAVRKLGVSGGSAVDVASAFSPNPMGLALGGTNVYSSVNWIMKVGVDGGQPVQLVAGRAHDFGVATDGTSVYWTNNADNTVMKVAVAGGPPVVLASGQHNPFGIAVDNTSVYWTNYDDNTVMKVGIDGGTPVTLASGQHNPLGIAAHGTSVYWTNAATDGSVMKVDTGGGTPVILAGGQSVPLGIAVDETSVYWANQGDGKVSRVER